MKQFLYILLTIIVLVLFVQAGYVLWDTYKVDSVTEEQKEILEARKQSILNTMRDEVPAVNEHMLGQGFWYTSKTGAGDNNIYFFDADSLARQGVTEEEMLLAKYRYLKATREQDNPEMIHYLRW